MKREKSCVLGSKKNITLSLMMFILISGFASAGGAEEKTTADYGFQAAGLPIVSKPITLTVLYPRTPDHGDFSKMWFMPYVAKRTGIQLEYNLVESTGWEEKKALAFASGDLPDVFMTGITKNDENAYGPSGLLANLAPYIAKYAPLTMSMYKKYPELVKVSRFPNGSIYVMPSINDSPRDNISAVNYINKAWLDVLGIKKPTNTDELYAALKAFKDKDPNGNGKADEIPMSSIYNRNLRISLLSAFGFVNPLHDIKDGKYIYVPAQPAYKSYLEYLNKLYVEKLLDNEYFSQTPQQILAKQSAGTIGFMDANPYSVLPNEVDYMKYDSLGPLTSSANSVKMWPANTAFNRAWGIFAMTKKSKYPEAAVRLIDYFYTTEGSRAVRVGPLFGSWEGDGGYQILEETATNVKAKLIMPGFTSYWAWRNAKAGPTGQPFMSNDLVNDIIVGADKKNSQLTSWIFNSGCREVRKFGYPEVSFTAEEQRKISSFVDMDNYVSMMDAKFITGEIKFDEWNRYLAELKRLGLDDMVAVRQGAYQRYESTPTDL